MKLTRKKPWYLEYLLIIVGTGLMATAITSCFDAAGMVTGGFSGIAILVKAGTKGLYGNGIPLWITNITLNIPLFIIATKTKGFKFVKKALFGDCMLTLWLAFLPAWKLSEDLLLVALYGGILQGFGIGMVFLGGGTTGGTDMLAAIIQKYLNHYSIAQIMQFIDGSIVIVGMYVFGVERALYAIIAVFLVTKVSDGIIEGLKFSKSVYIITDKPKEISQMVMHDLDRGITGISAKGMYSGEDKLMLFCVVGKKELVLLKEKIDETYKEVSEYIESLEFKKACSKIIELIEMGNKYYDERKPWIQKRENIEEFNNTIYTCTNIIANLSNLIEPIMPQTSKRLREYLKIERPLWKQIQIKEKISLGNIEILFERIDINKNR